MQEDKKKYRKPSERAAGFILNICGWIKYIIGSTSTVIPCGHTVQHQGNELKAGKSLRFGNILLVEDDSNRAGDFIDAIRSYYVCGSVIIFVAHAYNAAVTFFENEDINLVIMDSDLDDEDGDGAALTSQFLSRKPDLTILANSSSKISNMKLTGSGAKEILGKSPEKLKNWLSLHDPAGTDV